VLNVISIHALLLIPTHASGKITTAQNHNLPVQLMHYISLLVIIIMIIIMMMMIMPWRPTGCGVTGHIHKSARSSCALHLAKLLLVATEHSEQECNWITIIRKWIMEFNPTSQPTAGDVKGLNCKHSDPRSILAQAVSAKIECGNLQAAMRLVCSDDAPFMTSEETVASLRSKHPPTSQIDPSLDGVQCTPLLVDQNDVRKAILSFSAGSSGGPDGLWPQHMKALL